MILCDVCLEKEKEGVRVLVMQRPIYLLDPLSDDLGERAEDGELDIHLHPRATHICIPCGEKFAAAIKQAFEELSASAAPNVSTKVTDL